MSRSVPPVAGAFANKLLTAVVIVAVLHLASEVLIPIALSVLLTFLLATPVRQVQRTGLGRVPATLVVVLTLFGIAGGLAVIALGQMSDLAANLPAYKTQIVSKVDSLRRSGTQAWGRAERTLHELNDELAHGGKPAPAAHHASTARREKDSAAEVRPLTVTVVESASPPWSMIRSMIGPLTAPLATLSFITILVIFMLIEREDLRDRLLFLIGQGQLNLSTQALDDASHRVSRYLMMQTVLNAGVGFTIAVGLYAIGLPNAAIWGLVAALLRYVPYLGTVLSAAMPITLSLAVSSGWTQALSIAILFLVVELTCAHVLEPVLFGSSLGLSTVAVLLAAVFWSWMWGGIGLILATPLTACLVVAGRFVPPLEFITVMLGDRQPLKPEAQVYQRLLALDVEQASEVVEQWLEGKEVCALYDQVLIPALSLSEQDRHRGSLSDEQREFIFKSMKDIVADLDERPDDPAVTVPGPLAAPPRAVLCVGARDQADEITGLMLAQLLEARNVPVRTLPMNCSATEIRALVQEIDPVAVCISAVPPLAVMHARYLSKRMRKLFPRVRIVVGLWNGASLESQTHRRLQSVSIDTVTTSLAEAVVFLNALAAPEAPPPPTANEGPVVDPPLAAKD